MRKKSVLVSLFFICASFFLRSQTVIWTEDFNNGCTAACTAVGYSGANGAWTQTITGTEGADPNAWYVSCAENNTGVGNCSAGCGSNQTLHISAAIGNIICPNDCGAAYDAGGLCGLLSCPQTDRRIESPTINLTGQTGVTLNFVYIETGDGTNDNCTIWYFDGATWSLLFDEPATNNTGCGGQGKWTNFSIALPASANNNPNVKIGFRWVNNDDGVGTDPSVAIDDITLTVPGGAPPVPSFTLSGPVCTGTSIALNGTATNSPTSWAWSSNPGAGANIVSPTSQNTTIDFTAAGTYTITLTATNGSGSNNTTQAIIVNAEPTVTVTPNPVTLCAGTSTNLTASGATTYTWSPATGLTCTNCAVTTASPTVNTTYTVIGVSGTCDDTVTVPVTVTAAITAGATAASTVICTGGNTTLTGTGGTTYTWTADPSLSCTSCQSPTATPTVTTTYTVTVASGSCPTATAVVTVSVTPSIVATASASATSICSGSNTTLNSSGGGTYAWLPATGLSCTNCQSPVATPTATTTYTVSVSSGVCPTATAVVTVSVTAATVANVTTSASIICNGQTANLTATGGGTYSWAPAASLSCTTCPNPVASPTATTTYTVSVTNGTVCPTATASIVVTVNNCVFPVASYTTSTDSVCTGQCVSFASTSTGGPTSYSWSFVGGNVGNPSTSSSAADTFCFVTPGTYSVQLIVQNGVGSDTIVQSVVVVSPPVASVNPSLDTVVLGTSTNLLATSNANWTYSWSPAAGLSCTSCSTTVATPTVSTWYYCTITNDLGCSTEDSAFVYVDIVCGEVFVANAFSPNGDYNNDVIHVKGNCVTTMEWVIFDRWGEKVFEATNPSEGWDGTYKGKAMDAAVFYYHLKAKTVDGKEKEMKGSISLIR